MLPLGCPTPNASGNVGAVGPVDAPLCLIGEAAGKVEAIKGVPFSGPAGDHLNRLLTMAGIKREEVRIVNVIACHPPNDWLNGAPWEGQALAHCRPQLDAVLNEPHRVFIPLGGTALRSVLNLPRTRGKDGLKVQDFHGAPVKLTAEKWVVPTFHPSHLLQGAQKLTKVVCYDLQVAKDIASGTLDPDSTKPDLVIDPPVDWFADWAAHVDAADWLAVDVETPEKEDDESESELGAGPIIRINFSYSTDQGITVPWTDPYLPTIKALLASPAVKCLWNAAFDQKKLRQHGIRMAGTVYDFMDAWHVLQSSLPRGLGFVSPLYSHAGPWKHLGSKNTDYCALDAVQTLRCAFGIYRDLQAEGLWPVYLRRMFLLDTLCFRPAEEIGLKLDRAALQQFGAELEAIVTRIEAECQPLIPEHVKPVSAPLKRKPDSMEGVHEVIEEDLIKLCETCGAEQITVKHRCADKALVPSVVIQPRQVPRYYRRLPFNPASWQQVLGYIVAKKHKPGKAKKTKKDTTDKKTLQRLMKTGDPLYPLLLQHRAAAKMRGTYADGMLERLDKEDRVHSTFTNTPSTLRKASTNPNLQNVANHVQFADGFRKCVIAAPGCKLLAADFSGIEAVLVGYFSGDPIYIRLAKLGIHAYLTGFLPEVNQPADLKWSDDDLRAHFKMLKTQFDPAYNRAKRCVHGRNYGLTEYGMSDYYPDVFPKRADAAKVISIYEEVCPKLKPWWARTRRAAHEKRYLGGFASGRAQTHDAKYHELMTEFAHPFGYRHWFWDVIQFSKVQGSWVEKFGEDAKRALAFFPQSSAMGVIQEAMLRLFTPGGKNYLGDFYNGQTPLRAQIHDDLTLEIPDARLDEAMGKLVAEMTRPVEQLPMPREWGLGDYLTIGVEVKVGSNWAPKSDSNPGGMATVSGATEAADVWRDEEPEDEFADVRIDVA